MYKKGENITHGATETSEYRTWCHMKGRCLNSNDAAYKDYGGRGIKICDRWANSFEAFLADMGCKPSPKHSLDRFPDVNGNYEPSNCRWATPKEQAFNRRNNRLINYNGDIKPLKEWTNELGLKYKQVYKRIYNFGWSINEAFTTPIVREKRYLYPTKNLKLCPEKD